jgi:hypothetical protein
MANRHPWRRAAHAHGRGRDSRLKETVMYRITLREQADVLARITLSAPPDTTRSAVTAAVREGHATAMQVLEIRHSLQRWAELGKGNARDDARRALAQVDDDGQGVRWYET